MKEGNAKTGTDRGQVLGPEVGPVVGIEADRQPPPDNGFPEDMEEVPRLFGKGEFGKGNDPGGIIDDGNQVGLALPLSLTV